MSSQISPVNLPSIQYLFKDKIQELNSTLGNWNIQNVRENDAYEKSLAHLMNLVLLTPITIGNPSILNNRSSSRNFPSSYSHPFGGTRTVNIITVSYPVNGSIQLFNYGTDGYSISSSDTVIYKPDFDNITIEVELDTLDRERTIAAANEKMRTTTRHINQVNPVAVAWSEGIEPDIITRAAAKRQELLAFYR